MFFIIVSMKFLDEASANGIDHVNSSDQVTPSSSRLKPEKSERSPGKKGVTKEVMFDIGDSRRSSNSYVPSESDLEDDEESSSREMNLLDDTSRIPRYLYKGYYMAARRYEISLRVLKYFFQHKKRNFVSASDHVMFYLLYKHQ